jgi:hypothetical protein
MAGVESTGFTKKTLDDIKTAVEGELSSTISPNLNFASDTLLGQIIGIFSDQLRELWDVSESVYNSFNPDAATGQSLANLGGLNGLTYSTGTRSTATGLVNLAAGATLVQNISASQSSTGARWIVRGKRNH